MTEKTEYIGLTLKNRKISMLTTFKYTFFML